MVVIASSEKEIMEDKLATIEKMCRGFLEVNGTCSTLAQLVLGVINGKSDNRR
jgi:hypothetical protein